MSDRLDNPERLGRYDDELVAHVLDAMSAADGIEIPYDSNVEVRRDNNEAYAGRVRLTVFVSDYLDDGGADT